jgi:hypothetical protein
VYHIPLFIKKSLRPPYQCVADPERYCRIRILLLRVLPDPDPVLDPALDLWQVLKKF